MSRISQTRETEGTVGAVKDSVGELLAPNQIIYRDAFDGLKADMRYTYGKGFFEAANLKLDLVYVQSSANLVQQLAAGSLDITMSTGLVDPIRAISQKASLAIVRFEMHAPPYAISAKSVSPFSGSEFGSPLTNNTGNRSRTGMLAK